MKLIIATIIAILFAMPATAQLRNCAPRDVVLNRLATEYGETRQMVGLNSSSAVVEVFASPATGSWTIIITNAKGLTCVATSGKNFERIKPVATKGDPT